MSYDEHGLYVPKSKRKMKLENSSETIGEWLQRMGRLEKKLSPKQLTYLTKDPYYQLVMEAVTYQLNKAGERVHEWLDFPMEDSFRSFRYHVPSESMGVTIKPQAVEDTIRFWANTENMVLAEIAVQALNKEIQHRTVYGVRGELAPANGHVLSWSNAAERWVVYGREWKKGEELRLDANETFAPYELEFLRHIAHLLDPLPLFSGSIEAKTRGRIGWQEGTTFWATAQKIRQMEESERKKHR